MKKSYDLIISFTGTEDEAEDLRKMVKALAQEREAEKRIEAMQTEMHENWLARVQPSSEQELPHFLPGLSNQSLTDGPPEPLEDDLLKSP